MNFQAARIQTFYLIKNFNMVEKYSTVTKGFYYDSHLNKLICYRCERTYELDSVISMNIDSHECGTELKHNEEDVPIPSPYAQCGAVNVQNDLNYEEFRYATFANWAIDPNIKLSKVELASTGFYYAAGPNTLKCFYCKTVVDKKVIPSRTLDLHRNNKKCLQKKYSFQIRVNNLSQDHVVSYREKRKTTPTTNADPKAGSSAITIDATPPVLSPASQRIQKAVEIFLRDPEKKSFYTVALNLGFDKHLVNKAIMYRLQLENTFETKEELIDFCLTFGKNQNTIETIKRSAEERERDMECKICMDNRISVVFKPCHHVVACLECGSKVKTCPMCCTSIGECSKIYF